MQDGFEVGLFFCADPVTADLTTVDWLKIHRVDEVVDG